MDFVLKKRSFLSHIILFVCTAGLWLFIYPTCFILNKKYQNKMTDKFKQTIYERELLQKENDLLELELKQQKINELKIKNAKGLVDLYNNQNK